MAMTLSRVSMRAAAGLLSLAFASAAALVAAAPAQDAQVRAGYRADIAAAMMAMHTGMQIPFSGNVDADFVAMMIAHHQGAIDMARAELRFGRNERVRRIAQEIVIEQQQEIAAMRLAIGQPPWPQPSGAAATSSRPVSSP
jgi:uncharacterized protein (DUF305 family)